MSHYKATRSRSQGRPGYAVIFRHPVRPDPLHPNSGRRIRRGLGTANEAEADRMVAQINSLLADETYWSPSARSAAATRLDPRVVAIFFDSMEGGYPDPLRLRDEVLPLPTRDVGYRQVLLLGTTGAGKTTVVRQLLGTDPKRERFPSTSTAKTTTADTELIFADSEVYKAVVTFVPRDELIDSLAENMSEAAVAASGGKSEREITFRLLDHVNQRFRFSYVLGRPPIDDDDVDDEDEDAEILDFEPEDLGDIDLERTQSVVSDAVGRLKTLVQDFETNTRDAFNVEKDDERVLEELIEEELESELRQSEEFHTILDDLFEEVERRFKLLDEGNLTRDRQGWPQTWQFETGDRRDFLRTVARFSSNHAPLFGRLLTPLVNGIRVSGPFVPDWAEGPPKLVLIDGEGLGHTPTSAATLSTEVVKKIDTVDAILLVDNAANPMQAAPAAAMKSIAAAGNGSKLHLAFTHFDQVKGDNLPTFSDREQHVLGSVDNVLRAIGDELGKFAERSLRRSREDATFFLGGIHAPLSNERRASKRTISELRRLVISIDTAGPRDPLGEARPIYDRVDLAMAVSEATKHFHNRWHGMLGLSSDPAYPKEHWTRIKALSRRLAEGWQDEYADLQPIANLRDALQNQIYLMFQQPIGWTGEEPSDEGQQDVVDAFSNAVAQEIIELTRRRLTDEVRQEWRDAFRKHGEGSTFVRARIIATDVYERGAPVPTVAASPDRNELLHEVSDAIAGVAEEMGIILS